jgi:hypothetical protein
MGITCKHASAHQVCGYSVILLNPLPSWLEQQPLLLLKEAALLQGFRDQSGRDQQIESKTCIGIMQQLINTCYVVTATQNGQTAIRPFMNLEYAGAKGVLAIVAV